MTSAHRGEVIITITSAKPLEKSISSRLESALKTSQFATTGGAKSVKFDYKVNSSLQGGMTVDLGDRSVDLSVANRVNKLNALLRGTYSSPSRQGEILIASFQMANYDRLHLSGPFVVQVAYCT